MRALTSRPIASLSCLAFLAVPWGYLIPRVLDPTATESVGVEVEQRLASGGTQIGLTPPPVLPRPAWVQDLMNTEDDLSTPRRIKSPTEEVTIVLLEGGLKADILDLTSGVKDSDERSLEAVSIKDSTTLYRFTPTSLYAESIDRILVAGNVIDPKSTEGRRHGRGPEPSGCILELKLTRDDPTAKKPSWSWSRPVVTATGIDLVDPVSLQPVPGQPDLYAAIAGRTRRGLAFYDSEDGTFAAVQLEQGSELVRSAEELLLGVPYTTSIEELSDPDKSTPFRITACRSGSPIAFLHFKGDRTLKSITIKSEATGEWEKHPSP